MSLGSPVSPFSVVCSLYTTEQEAQMESRVSEEVDAENWPGRTRYLVPLYC